MKQNKSKIDVQGISITIYNTDFNYIEFEGIKNEF